MDGDEAKKNRTDASNLRLQMQTLIFGQAMRSAQGPIETDGYFKGLLKKLDEA
ncbi:hypothetical protein [Phyllobacterium sp. K27]